MAKWIKNISGETKTYVGVEIQTNTFFQIPHQLLPKFENSQDLLSDILANNVQMSRDGSTVLSGIPIEHLNYLRSDIPVHSDTGAMASSPKYAPDGWTQRIHEIEFETCQIGSIHDKNYLGEDIGWGQLKFYDANGGLMTDQTLINLNCVRTDFEWMPTVDYMIKGGLVAQKVTPAYNFYVWVQAVVLPIEYGGPQVTFCEGGLNLAFIDSKTHIGLDGVSGSILYYSHPQLGPGMGTNKLRFVCRHPAGFHHDLQAIFNLFRA